MTPPAKLNLCLPPMGCMTAFLDRDRTAEEHYATLTGRLERMGWDPEEYERARLRELIDRALED